jgi:hypothetical protein
MLMSRKPAAVFLAFGDYQFFQYFECLKLRLNLFRQNVAQTSTFSAVMNASCGMSTLPNCRMRFLPFFCLSSSLRS